MITQIIINIKNVFSNPDEKSNSIKLVLQILTYSIFVPLIHLIIFVYLKMTKCFAALCFEVQVSDTTKLNIVQRFVTKT